MVKNINDLQMLFLFFFSLVDTSEEILVLSNICTSINYKVFLNGAYMLGLHLEHAFGEFVCICILSEMRVNFDRDVHFKVCKVDHILIEMCILECTFRDHICICILIAMHTF